MSGGGEDGAIVISSWAAAAAAMIASFAGTAWATPVQPRRLPASTRVGGATAGGMPVED